MSKRLIIALAGVLLVVIGLVFVIYYPNDNKNMSQTSFQKAVQRPLAENKIVGADTLLHFKIFFANQKKIGPQTETMTLACRKGRSLRGTTGFNFDIVEVANQACQKVLKIDFSNPDCALSRLEDGSAGWAAIEGNVRDQKVDVIFKNPGCQTNRKDNLPTYSFEKISSIWAAIVYNRKQIDQMEKINIANRKAQKAAEEKSKKILSQIKRVEEGGSP